ncbi:MAG: YggS family pyridoxal phosphate enzyme [Coriobacteriales bacterium]|nr:YggS family pyridoxal phosphate enzyme [Coriobacteriales bacterium]
MDISTNYATVLKEVAAACARVGRDPSEVRVVAVSKTVGVAEVAAAIAAGIRDFGENRTALFQEKQAAFSQVNWHFIGSIQTNKVKDFVGKAALVHSVASERALIAIARRAELLAVTQPVLLEVNVSGEVSKDGIAPTELPDLLSIARGLSGIRVRGLMTMAPQGEPEATRAAFKGLRLLRDKLATSDESLVCLPPAPDAALTTSGSRGFQPLVDSRVTLYELSMGMSEDYSIAVEEGATIVRIGRSIWM